MKRAIHAPVNVDWTECSNVNVFPNGDASLPSALTVLPNVIEKSNRSVVVHGLAVSLYWRRCRLFSTLIFWATCVGFHFDCGRVSTV